ncbi:uncharacterized protein [Paramormyrops kingsleyae]|uniref:uncharacterized protein n=1 Tax=Paramormyrops kingsleyae TaxID=1676925 RepID=UPI003B96D06F
MFSFADIQNGSYRMQCLLCLPRTTKISAFKNSSSNLRKHIERKHPNHLKNYSNLTSIAQKRKNVSRNMEPLTKQLKIGETKIISQATVDKAVLRFIVYGLQPFSVVEKDEFKDLIHDLQPNSTVRSRSTICTKIEEAAGGMKKSVTEAMSRVEYICTTTDCWSSRRRSFIVERILKIMKEKGDGVFRNLCVEFKIPMFTPAEKAFLGEYVTAMAPVAKAINILQGETNVHMGWLLPTLNVMVSKLKRAKISMKLCKSLVDAILEGVNKRFGDMLNNPELIAAAILLPKFKTYWTTDDAILNLGLDFIKGNMEENSQLTSDSTSSEEEDFFKPLKTSRAQQGPAVLDGYLTYAGDDMGVLKTFPSLLKLSLRLNTPLPASAACERLFSSAGLIFRPKRARVSSKNFENQLLLKLNKNIAPL